MREDLRLSRNKNRCFVQWNQASAVIEKYYQKEGSVSLDLENIIQCPEMTYV